MTINQAYMQKAIDGALSDFDNTVGPNNINDPLYALMCRLIELSNADPGELSVHDAEQLAVKRAQLYGHSDQSIKDTWRSAERTIGSTKATIPAPTFQPAQPKQGYADLADYAQRHCGVPESVFTAAGWSNASLWTYTYIDRHGKPQIGLTPDEQIDPASIERRAVRFDTDAGSRWRLIDQDKPAPKYWHPYKSHLDANKAWYKLPEALVLAQQVGYLVIANGEPGVIIGQHSRIPAICETGGGEKLTPDRLLQLLRLMWTGPVLIALDGDKKGYTASPKKREQYASAGYSVRALDLGAGLDLASFCTLHQANAMADLLLCADLPMPASQQQAQAATPAQASQSVQPAFRTQSQAIADQLARWGYTFRLNRAGNVLECNGEPMDDELAAELRVQYRDAGLKSIGMLEDVYRAEARRNAYHPVQDYLTGLVWDSANHINRLAGYLHSDDPDIVYPDGTTRRTTEVYLRRWLIGCVGKIFDYVQNAMLVLGGPEDIGKSSFARWLSSPLPKLHFEGQIQPNERDSLLRFATHWLWEVAEIDATTRRADRSALKGALTTEWITLRRAYGRFDIHAPAMASFIGTFNPDNTGFLDDPTGSRRFWITTLTEIDWAYQKDICIDQVWAEALAAYRAGEPWRLLPEETVHRKKLNENHEIEDPMLDFLERYFRFDADQSNRMTSAEIIMVLYDKDVPLDYRNSRSLAIAIGRALKKRGVLRVGGDTNRYYAGVIPC